MDPYPAPDAPPPTPLPPTVRALGWTSFLTDLSSEAIYPLLPAFITRELGGSALAVGLIDGAANAVAAVMRLPSGALSDAVGRRPLVIVGYGLSALFRPLMAFVGSPWGVLLVRAADRFGKGIRSAPRDALVSDLVAPAMRGRASATSAAWTISVRPWGRWRRWRFSWPGPAGNGPSSSWRSCPAWRRWR